VGIIGATVMPHGLFVGCALATQDRASVKPVVLPSMPDRREARPKGLLERFVDLFRPVQSDTQDEFASHADRPNNSLSFVKAHLRHSVVDIVVNLLGLAVVINSFAVFHQHGVNITSADLYDAHDILRDMIGRGAAVIFAIALLFSGESASLIATVAGQIVSEGFLRWHVSPVVRRLLTRLLSLIPSVIMAVSVGRPGINAMLVASQVVLSLVLPFVVFPLVWLTSSRTVMRVPVPAPARSTQKEEGAEEDPNVTEDVYLYFNNGWVVAGIGYIIWASVVVANVYVLIMLVLGNGS